MKQLVDMEKNTVIAVSVEEAFLMELQKAVPQLVSAEIVQLTREVVKAIPAAWKALVKPFTDVLGNRAKAYLAVSDIAEENAEYAAFGRLVREDASPLAFHKLVMLDNDLIENDYLGGVITDAKGAFRLTFDAKTFNDTWFKTKTIPKFIFRVFQWRQNHFVKVAEFKPKPSSVEKPRETCFLIDFGPLQVSIKP